MTQQIPNLANLSTTFKALTFSEINDYRILGESIACTCLHTLVSRNIALQKDLTERQQSIFL